MPSNIKKSSTKIMLYIPSVSTTVSGRCTYFFESTEQLIIRLKVLQQPQWFLNIFVSCYYFPYLSMYWLRNIKDVTRTVLESPSSMVWDRMALTWMDNSPPALAAHIVPRGISLTWLCKRDYCAFVREYYHR